jgi:hypothetical protein
MDFKGLGYADVRSPKCMGVRVSIEGFTGKTCWQATMNTG